MPDPCPLRDQQFRVGRERRQRRSDEFGGVHRGRRRAGGLEADGATQQHVLLVLGVGACRGDPFRATMPAAEGGEFLGPGPAFGRTHHEIAQRLGEAVGAQRRTQVRRPVPGPVLDVAGQQFTQHDVLLGTGDQARRRIVVRRGLQPQDRERIRVHRPHQRLPKRAAERAPSVGGVGSGQHAPGDLLTQRCRCLAAGCQHQDRLRLHIGRPQSRDGRVDDQRRLSAAGSAVDANRPPRTLLGVRGPGVGGDDPLDVRWPVAFLVGHRRRRDEPGAQRAPPARCAARCGCHGLHRITHRRQSGPGPSPPGSGRWPPAGWWPCPP